MKQEWKQKPKRKLDKAITKRVGRLAETLGSRSSKGEPYSTFDSLGSSGGHNATDVQGIIDRALVFSAPSYNQNTITPRSNLKFQKICVYVYA